MPQTLTISPREIPHVTPDPAAIRAEIVRLDLDASNRRNASHLTKENTREINRLEHESAKLSATLPECREAKQARAEKTAAQRDTFRKGRALYQKRQEQPLNNARTALAALTDPSLPPALHRQINTLILDIDTHMAKMNTFHASDGIPDAMRRLLPFSLR